MWDPTRNSCADPASVSESRSDGQRVHTSAGVRQLCPAEEAQVSGPSPDGLRVSEAESGAEVVRLQRLVAVNSEVSAGVVATVDPDLQPHTTVV